MAQYRLYLTDHRGRIFDVHADEFATDHDALAAALQVARHAFAIQVWQGGRFVGKRRVERKPVNFRALWLGHGEPALVATP